MLCQQVVDFVGAIADRIRDVMTNVPFSSGGEGTYDDWIVTEQLLSLAT